MDGRGKSLAQEPADVVAHFFRLPCVAFQVTVPHILPEVGRYEHAILASSTVVSTRHERGADGFHAVSLVVSVEHAAQRAFPVLFLRFPDKGLVHHQPVAAVRKPSLHHGNVHETEEVFGHADDIGFKPPGIRFR